MITKLIAELGHYGFVLEFVPNGEDKFKVWAVRENKDPNKTMRLLTDFDVTTTPDSDDHLIHLLKTFTGSAEGWERNGYFNDL